MGGMLVHWQEFAHQISGFASYSFHYQARSGGWASPPPVCLCRLRWTSNGLQITAIGTGRSTLPIVSVSTPILDTRGNASFRPRLRCSPLLSQYYRPMFRWVTHGFFPISKYMYDIIRKFMGSPKIAVFANIKRMHIVEPIGWHPN